MKIKKEIKQAVEEFERAKLAEAHLNKVITRIEETRQALWILESKLDRADARFNNNVANFSLKGLFLVSLGDNESQLEQERQQYLETALRYRELMQSLKLLEFERDVLSKKVGRLKELESNLNILIKSRAQLLDESDKSLKQAIDNIDRTIMHHFRTKAKVEEAKKMGYKIIEYVYRMLDLFDEAGNWGYSHSLFSSTNPHTKISIDKSEAYLSRIKQLLIMLEEELEHINLYTGRVVFRLQISGDFSSIYIDNLILDWIVRGKIQHAASTLDNVKDRIELNLDQLRALGRRIEQEVAQLEMKKRDLLIVI